MGQSRKGHSALYRGHYSLCKDFYKAHGTCAQVFLKYYNRNKQSGGHDLSLLPGKRGTEMLFKPSYHLQVSKTAAFLKKMRCYDVKHLGTDLTATSYQKHDQQIHQLMLYIEERVDKLSLRIHAIGLKGPFLIHEELL